MFGSEGGIDGSNLPYSLVSLPLEKADFLAEDIRSHIMHKLKKQVTVLIVDTDKTYSFGNFHFTPRPNPLKGIFSRGGLCMYLAGRFLNLKKRPTPLAIAGEQIQVEEALKIANIADRARGPGSGSTVWDMAARFKVGTSAVTWSMLETLKHKPIVLVRKDQS
jgi:F420-0:gamma-glutamyl ligase-like protein